MAPALIRDAFVGDILYHASGHRLFQHPEDHQGFTIPTPPRSVKSIRSGFSSRSDLETTTVIERPDDEESRLPRVSSDQHTIAVPDASEEQKPTRQKAAEVEEGDLAKEKEKASVRQEIADSLIVEWYEPNDPEDPQNVCPSFFFAWTCFSHTLSGPSPKNPSSHSRSACSPSASTSAPRSTLPALTRSQSSSTSRPSRRHWA